MTISKSLYKKGIQCPKALWLKTYKPSVLTPPNELAQTIFDTGNRIGDLACELFPNGKEVPYSKNYDEMIAITKEWLDDGVENIYEATFNFFGILVMVDILTISNGEVSIYEEKMAYRKALLEYCKLDTLAMVEILKKLRDKLENNLEIGCF